METVPVSSLLGLSSKVAIVTGGAAGIGLGIVSRLAEAGASVVVADISKDAADEAAVMLSGKGWSVKSYGVDVANEEEVKGLINYTADTFGEIDILVNNAGIYPDIPVSKMTSQQFDRVIAVNLRAVFLTTKYVSEKMIARGSGGKIINITSIDALHPSMVGLDAYDASKHGVWGFTKDVALELAPHKIWVNAVAPGGIATPGVAKMQSGSPGAGDVDPQKLVESFLAGIPMHRMGDPDDIGKVVLFLASDMSSYMTGSQIVVDGGFLLN